MATNGYLSIADSMTGSGRRFGLPQNYGFSDLAGYEQQRRRSLGDLFKSRIGELRTGIGTQYDTALQGYRDTAAKRRAELATSLGAESQKRFQLQNPQILEDLNSRGVFTSPTAVAKAQAQALKELELENSRRLGIFDEETRGYEDALGKEKLNLLNELDQYGASAQLQGEQDAADAEADLYRGELERQIQEAQSRGDMQLARDLAEQGRRNGITTSLISAGGGILGGIAGSDGFSKFLSGLGSRGVEKTVLDTGTGTAGGLGGKLSLLESGGGGEIGSAAPAAGAGGIGLGGAAAIGGAGLGAALLSRYAQKTAGGGAKGTAAGIFANPIGYQLNKGKELIKNPSKTISKALGGGKSGSTGSGDATANEQRRLDADREELARLKQELSPEEYAQVAQAKIDEITQRVGHLAGKGKKWASAINPVWQRFLDAGLVSAQNGRWVAV